MSFSYAKPEDSCASYAAPKTLYFRGSYRKSVGARPVVHAFITSASKTLTKQTARVVFVYRLEGCPGKGNFDTQ